MALTAMSSSDVLLELQGAFSHSEWLDLGAPAQSQTADARPARSGFCPRCALVVIGPASVVEHLAVCSGTT